LRVDRRAGENRAIGVRKNEPIPERINKQHIQTAPGLFCDPWILLGDTRWIPLGNELLYIFLDLVCIELDCRTKATVASLAVWSGSRPKPPL
jgi:hypothetical protein